ncbi:hypothetical protein DU69_13835 [Methanosarcina mazei]|uniref:Uncharacterized protein n=1 Tax=Methanosarcina mazei TaxID=2209 RepID=A0A0F8IZP7_METMZ|nr:hypothetical protein DU69_13835 [Methanosarcina mazei]
MNCKEGTVQQEWKMKPIDFESKFSAAELRKLYDDGPKIGGHRGAWSDCNIYVSLIGGIKGHGGMPYKLKTSTGSIPISRADAEELLRTRKIRKR